MPKELGVCVRGEEGGPLISDTSRQGHSVRLPAKIKVKKNLKLKKNKNHNRNFFMV
jgi:hypothetical protein